MDDDVDLMQIKIEKAKSQLSDDTLNAINSVDWKAAILKLRETKGYSFEQLGDLELETELVLCGLLSVADYPKEVRTRLKLGEAQTNELVNEMNEQVFSRIKEELIRRTERKKIFAQKNTPVIAETPVKTPVAQTPAPAPLQKTEEETKNTTQMLGAHGIEIIGEGAKTEVNSILTQKLSGTVQIPSTQTDHSLENLTKATPAPTPPSAPTSYPPKSDPYRLPPE